jgi:predicted DNA-binding protein with PD1-like motif
MITRLLHDHDGQRTFVLIFETGDEAMSLLRDFARQQRLHASHFSAIGAFLRATVAYFEWETKQYRNIAIEQQVEVLTLSGDITEKDGEPNVHAHVVLGKADASAVGGHLVEAIVRPTLEVVLVESPAYLRRVFDPATGLALIDPRASKPRG